MESRLQTKYRQEVIPALKEKFGLKNSMQAPRIVKVVLNVGYGRMVKDTAFIENVEKTLTAISGQKPMHNATRKSISNFKTREGMKVGVSVTLRGKRMYDFLDKFVNITLPRVRDFHGIDPKSFDKQGNYSIGLKENIAFPEMESGAIEKLHGLQIVITTTAKNKETGLELLKKLGFPFRDK